MAQGTVTRSHGHSGFVGRDTWCRAVPAAFSPWELSEDSVASMTPTSPPPQILTVGQRERQPGEGDVTNVPDGVATASPRSPPATEALRAATGLRLEVTTEENEAMLWGDSVIGCSWM